MHFADLSPYLYNRSEPCAGVLTIGWLDWHVTFPRGPVSPDFLAGLDRCLLHAVVNRMRGYHECNLCWGSEMPTHKLKGFDVPGTGEPTYVLVGDRRVMLGSAEIWVPGDAGLIFAAPDLVVHYVRDHEYLPPAEFVRAVVQFQPSSWNAEGAFTAGTSMSPSGER